MKNSTTKISLAVILILISLVLFVVYPIGGLYLLCLSAIVLFRLCSKLNKWKNNIISIVLFSSIWLLLIDKAFELQARRIADDLCGYSNLKKMPGDHYLQNNWMAYSPVFTKYTYTIKKEKPESFDDIELSYIDIWGNYKVYCDADGEFETRDRNTHLRIN